MKKYETEIGYISLVLIIILYFSSCHAKAATYAFNCVYGEKDLIFVVDSKDFPKSKTIYYDEDYTIDIALTRLNEETANAIIVEKNSSAYKKYNVECVYSNQ